MSLSGPATVGGLVALLVVRRRLHLSGVGALRRLLKATDPAEGELTPMPLARAA